MYAPPLCGRLKPNIHRCCCKGLVAQSVCAQSGVCGVAAGDSVSEVGAAGCTSLHKSVGALTALSQTLAAMQASGVRGCGR